MYNYEHHEMYKKRHAVHPEQETFQNISEISCDCLFILSFEIIFKRGENLELRFGQRFQTPLGKQKNSTKIKK